MNGDILARAQQLHDDLDGLWVAIEHSSFGPEMKSALARDLMESQERVDAVIRAYATA
jgi:hypothetical protein